MGFVNETDLSLEPPSATSLLHDLVEITNLTEPLSSPGTACSCWD